MQGSATFNDLFTDSPDPFRDTLRNLQNFPRLIPTGTQYVSNLVRSKPDLDILRGVLQDQLYIVILSILRPESKKVSGNQEKLISTVAALKNDVIGSIVIGYSRIGDFGL